MSAPFPPTLREKHPVAHSVGGRAIQTVQGLYYVIAGLSVALTLHLFQSVTVPYFDLSGLWVIRVIGLFVAAFGVALIASGRRKNGPFIGAGVALCVALVLLVEGAACLTFRALPPLFLLDLGAEFGFVCWWAVAIFIRVGSMSNRSMSAPTSSLTPPE